MADTVGLVVGIVSLGIQVCQGLITYYHDFREQGSEIDNLSARLQILCDTLATIESSVNGDPRIQAQSSAQQVQATILSTYSGVVRLETFLKRCRQAASDESVPSSLAGPARRPIYADVKRGIRKQLSKAAYPFRKGTLKSLKETIADLQANLSTAMAALHLDTSKAILDETATIKTVAKGIPTSIDDIDARISALNDLLVSVSESLPVLQVNVEQIRNTMESSLPALQSSICKIAEDIPALESRLVVKADLCSDTNVESTRQPDSDDLEALVSNVRDLQLNLSRHPSLLKTALDDRRDGIFNSAVGLSMGSSNSSLAWCCCEPGVLGIRRSGYRQKGVLFYRSMDIHRHLPGCPFKNYTRGRMVYGVNLLFCNYLLKGLFQASVSMTTGAGGNSISSNLTFRTIVSSTESPAFRIVEALRNDLQKLKMVSSNLNRPSQMIRTALKQLQRVFTERSASPADLDIHGNTILHAACSFWGVDGMHNFLCDPAGLVEYQRLIMYLCNAVKSVGVSINETNFNGLTPFKLLLDRLFTMTRCNTDILSLSGAMVAEGADVSEWYFRGNSSYLIESRAYPHNPIHSKIHLAEYLTRTKLSIQFLDESSLESQLNAAVVARSLSDVESVLRDMDVQNINLDSLGYSPLHRAIWWPEGVSMLINAAPHLMNLPSTNCELPIHFACYHGCYGTAKLLLERGSDLDVFNHYALLYALRSNHEEVVDLIIKNLADRRMQLFDLARYYLPRAKVLQIANDRVPDADANSILNELTTLSAHLPELLDRHFYFGSWHRGTVYHVLFSHCGPDLVKTAQKLYKAGFLDVDATDGQGWTPLMHPWDERHLGADDAAIANWLLSRGAAMGKLLPDDSSTKTGATAIHFLAHRMGLAFERSLRRPDEEGRLADRLFISDSTLTEVFCHIAFCFTVDECSCPCSLGGCLPLTIFLRRICGLKHGSKWKMRLLLFINWMSKHLIEHISRMIVSGVAVDIIQEVRVKYCSSIIRFLSFETLGIQHSCCLMRSSYRLGIETPFLCRSSDEVTEITEEYQDVIGVLESLIGEFDTIIRSRHEISLFELVRRHWVPRIGEVLCKLSDEWSDGLAANRCAEMGIVWQSQEDESDGEWSDNMFNEVLDRWPHRHGRDRNGHFWFASEEFEIDDTWANRTTSGSLGRYEWKFVEFIPTIPTYF